MWHLLHGYRTVENLSATIAKLVYWRVISEKQAEKSEVLSQMWVYKHFLGTWLAAPVVYMGLPKMRL